MGKSIRGILAGWFITTVSLPEAAAHVAVLNEKSCHSTASDGYHCHSVWGQVGTDTRRYRGHRPENKFSEKELVIFAQKHLRLLGYYEGDIDGKSMESTVAAVMAYQKDIGKRDDGAITRSLILDLVDTIEEKFGD